MIDGRRDDALARDLGLDVWYAEFSASRNDEEFTAYLGGLPADVEVGAPGLVHSYVEWGYLPNVVEVNPLGAAESVEDLARHQFPDFSSDERYSELADRVAAAHCGLPDSRRPAAPRRGAFRDGLPAPRLRAVHGRPRRQPHARRLPPRPARGDHAPERGRARRARASTSSSSTTTWRCRRVCSSAPDPWRQHFRPRLARIIQTARVLQPSMRVLYHSDGDYTSIVSDLIAVGVDALNPLQPDHMDPREIKLRYGDLAAIWGAVGPQGLFGQGSPSGDPGGGPTANRRPRPERLRRRAGLRRRLRPPVGERRGLRRGRPRLRRIVRT